jgi:hypothetical protein
MSLIIDREPTVPSIITTSSTSGTGNLTPSIAQLEKIHSPNTPLQKLDVSDTLHFWDNYHSSMRDSIAKLHTQHVYPTPYYHHCAVFMLDLRRNSNKVSMDELVMYRHLQVTQVCIMDGEGSSAPMMHALCTSSGAAFIDGRRVLRDRRLVQCAAGTRHIMFLDDTGLLWACGDNTQGECGIHPTPLPSSSSNASSSSSSSTAHANEGAVVVTNHIPTSKPICVQLSYPETHPVRDMRFAQVVCGGRSTMVRTADGRVLVCGSNDYCKFGGSLPETIPLLAAVPELFGRPVADIALSPWHAVWVSMDRRSWASMGANSHGECHQKDHWADTAIRFSIPTNWNSERNRVEKISSVRAFPHCTVIGYKTQIGQQVHESYDYMGRQPPNSSPPSFLPPEPGPPVQTEGELLAMSKQRQIWMTRSDGRLHMFRGEFNLYSAVSVDAIPFQTLVSQAATSAADVLLVVAGIPVASAASLCESERCARVFALCDAIAKYHKVSNSTTLPISIECLRPPPATATATSSSSSSPSHAHHAASSSSSCCSPTTSSASMELIVHCSDGLAVLHEHETIMLMASSRMLSTLLTYALPGGELYLPMFSRTTLQILAAHVTGHLIRKTEGVDGRLLTYYVILADGGHKSKNVFLDGSSASEVLVAAHHFEMRTLTLLCEDVLVSYLPLVQSTLRLLFPQERIELEHMAQTYEATQLLQAMTRIPTEPRAQISFEYPFAAYAAVSSSSSSPTHGAQNKRASKGKKQSSIVKRLFSSCFGFFSSNKKTKSR